MCEQWKIMQVVENAPRPLPTRSGIPDPQAGEIQLIMHAAALNFADLLMIKGTYQETPPLPFVPGIEGAGEVRAVGAGVTHLKPGDRVAVFAQGTLAEAGNFEAARCTKIPDGMSYADAAAFQIAYGTSHLALTARGRLKRGETLVVLGAAGGVGLTAVEIGAALGARVIAVARGEERLSAVRNAGAEIAIDSDSCPDLKAALRELGGVDVVYDPVGDAPGLAAFGALRQQGRFLVIGFAGGKPSALPLNHALVKNIEIHGFYWGAYAKLDPALMRDSLSQLFEMHQSGALKPHLGAVLPLDRLSEGYDLLENRRSIGKVVITI